MLNTNKLYKNQIIKNYKELCNVLEIEEKKSGSKQYQLKELERYFDYEKNGNAFIIKEIYTQTKEKIDNRGGAHNNKYNQYLYQLILNLLSKEETKKVFLSTCKLFKELNMINDNYSTSKRNISKLSYYLYIQPKYVYDFFTNTHSKLIDILETALNSLQNQNKIKWEKKLTINLQEENIIKNKNGIFEKKLYNTRHANQAEIRIINQAEQDILNQMGYKSKKDVMLLRKWEEYNKDVIKLLKQQINIEYYYNSYNIELIDNNDYILPREGLIKTKTLLNETIIENFKNNLKKKQNKIKEKKLKQKISEKEEFKKTKEYKKNLSLICEKMIKENEEDIIGEMFKAFAIKNKINNGDLTDIDVLNIRYINGL